MSTMLFKIFLSATLCISLTAAKGQDRNTAAYYHRYYTGCWVSDSNRDVHLVTNADGSFQWVRPRASSGIPDTLKGTWRIRSVYSVPFKSTFIYFRFAKGGKERYAIGVTSRPAVIYLPDERELHKLNCDQ